MSGSKNTFGLLNDKIAALAFLLLILISCAEIFDLPEITMAPRITSIEPEEGPEGTIVTITGIQFSPNSESNKVRFNGKIAIITESTVNSIKAIVPEDAGTGPVEVVVENKATQGPDFKFLYYPAILTVEPLEGKPGAEVVLTGKYFAQEPDANLVQFGGRTATVLSTDSTTKLTVSIPADAQSGAVTVTVKGLTGIGPFFTVLPTEQPVHSISGIEPTSGKAGTVVRINGVNFSPVAANNLVKFKDAPAVIISASSEKLEVYAPEVGITGIVSVTIAGLIANGPVFTYVMDPPVISQYVPDSGYAGDTVQIIGKNFSAIPSENLVKFNGKDAKVLESTGLILKVIVPNDAGKGPVTITVGGQTGTGPEFNYLDNTPVINDFNPKSGPLGTSVVIQGGNFGNDPKQLLVKFNGVEAVVSKVENGNSITTTVPEGATTGPISVSINEKTATSQVVFTVSAPIVAGEWKPVKSMNNTRRAHTATLLPDGRVLVVGGDQTGTCEIYDPTSDTWSPTGSLNVRRYFHEAALLKSGKVLVVTGRGLGGDTVRECELYDPETGTWSFTGTPNFPRNFKISLLPNGDVLAIGNHILTNQMEVYKHETGVWELTAEMWEPTRINFNTTLLNNGKVLVSGGVISFHTMEFNSILFDPSQNGWSISSKLLVQRSSATANLLTNGEVLIAGGINSSGRLASAEIYNPNSETYRSAGNMVNPRFLHVSVGLPNNKILVIGGTERPSAPGNDCEIFDEINGQWRSISNTQYRSSQFTATKLQSGKVLIAGGTISAATPTNLCEIYTPE